MNESRHPVGIILLAMFFGAGALICLVTMLALAFPGGFLEPIWQLKPQARVEFQQIGNWSIALMAVVGAACGLAAIGLAKNTEWGRRLAIGILTVNLIGDTLTAILLHDPITLIGLPIGGLMIFYLIRKGERRED
jgi:sterol desaturase/sphingolipid hydroxylase (fatty acid hydroxylase superfamily)